MQQIISFSCNIHSKIKKMQQKIIIIINNNYNLLTFCAADIEVSFFHKTIYVPYSTLVFNIQ
jgi:hypothetical protein